MFTEPLLSNGSIRHNILHGKNNRKLDKRKIFKDLKKVFIAFSKHYPANFLQGLRNITKILREDSPGRDSN
jgi:hypothetical protein